MKIVAVVIVVVLFAGFAASIPLVNDHTARNIEKQLVEVDLPANTELIESLSKAGKLVGNGNGMQYFGAILLRSEKTLDELTAYYSQEFTNISVKEQKTQKVACLEHCELSFKTHIPETDNYYIVYLFGSGNSPFSDLDIRGH